MIVEFVVGGEFLKGAVDVVVSMLQRGDRGEVLWALMWKTLGLSLYKFISQYRSSILIGLRSRLNQFQSSYGRTAAFWKVSEIPKINRQ